MKMKSKKNNTELNFKIKEELGKNKIDNYINNKKYIKRRIFDKVNMGKINKEKKYEDKKEIKYPSEEITKIFRRSYNKLPNSNNNTITYSDNYKLDLKDKNNQNNKNNLNKYKIISTEEQKNEKMNEF